MAGVLLKNHYEPTCARAILVNRHHPDYAARAYGAAVMNWPLGGLNPCAVYSALQMGAKTIFFPMRDASHSLLYGNMPGDFFDRPGISLLDENGELRPEVYNIFEVMKQYDALLATGHISPRESLVVCRTGRAQGVRMVLAHPEWERTVIPPKERLL